MKHYPITSTTKPIAALTNISAPPFVLTGFPLFLGILLAAVSFLGSNTLHAQPFPRPDHIVIVIEENKSFTQVIDSTAAPYLNQLAKRGTLFTQSFGITHPSQPNYIALFTGSTQSVVNNACPLELTENNLARALLSNGFSFTSYAESMPQAGFTDCVSDKYKRKHNPTANWKELAAFNQPFSAFPQDFAKLPAVALVIPDLSNDMHDGSINQGDAWLAKNIEPYAQWAMTHNSLLIVTWDEDNGSADNRIATIFVGPMVKPGVSAQRIDHYNLLRTIEDMLGLSYLGNSDKATAIEGIWQEVRRK
jgi:acid phosphatase